MIVLRSHFALCYGLPAFHVISRGRASHDREECPAAEVKF